MSARALWLVAAAAMVPTVASAEDPADFGAEAKLLYRMVACSGTEPLSANIARPAVDRHCRRMLPQMGSYRTKYADEAKAFIAQIRPTHTPTTVVYPFGGADLLSALTTYPDAEEITTMSLEHAGDPRRAPRIAPSKLAESLEQVRKKSAGLLLFNDSTSENLKDLQRGELPGQLSLFIVALAVHGFQPVSLRYFRVEPGGSLHYLTASEIAELEPKKAGKLKSNWVSPDFSPAFSNSELTFVAAGVPGATPRVHRHIAQNLGDEVLGPSPVLEHLKKKGRIAAMTKAASYLLWWDSFSFIRTYLLDHMDVMISDSTGVPPRYFRPRGFVGETYGHFNGPFLNSNADDTKDFRDLWGSQPERFLPFRYGYLDSAKRFHMLVVKKKDLSTKAESEVVDEPAAAPLFQTSPRDAAVTSTRVELVEAFANGRHLRMLTRDGPVHVWLPTEPSTETVIYLHGYYTRVDSAWTEHSLLSQFQGSGRSAAFVVPEASSGNDEVPFWRDLGALLSEVDTATTATLSKSRVTAIAHSGGYRTIVHWLTDKRLEEIVLLDALYSAEKELRGWLRKTPNHKMVVIAGSTAPRATKFARSVRGAVIFDGLPAELGARVGAHRKHPLLVFRTDLEHMEIISGGRVMPSALSLGATFTSESRASCASARSSRCLATSRGASETD
ncbi:MAG: hypothetical protein HY791_21865 [Deltaproteobacteria bacterium]|nr:hypothetical protein [Deltaproteobacteria bacterium]